MPLDLLTSIASVRARLDAVRVAGTTVGFVPTMGALHGGHGKLIEAARRDCGSVVVSIFVNPLQFDREDDLRKYPRTLDTDRDMCERLGVNVIFAPTVEEIYPTPPSCTISVGHLADHLCGPRRPGHFESIATIVTKLVDIVEPHRAYFGEKDYQQLTIIRTLIGDLNIRTAIIGVPTLREADGLAMSSRNRLLSAAERPLATALYLALGEANRLILSGVTDSERVAREAAARVPARPGLRLEYLEIVDPATLQPVTRIDRPVRVAGALWVGTTRLIDNVASAPPDVATQ
jgi:pantoate--beta-alanine ligase